MRTAVLIGQSPRDGRDESLPFADFECIAHFDGACEPVNPGGHGGWGYVIRAVEGAQLGAELACGSGYIPASRQTTNNVAEYTAALEAVRAWLRLARSTPLLVCGDSKLVIMQMRGEWQLEHEARPIPSPAQVMNSAPHSHLAKA